MKSVNLYIPLLLLLFLAGACGTKKSDGASGALSDDALLDTVQRRTFNYFWDGAEPNSGLARERIHMDGVYPENDQNVVTSGGSGFGIMAVLAGIHRGYVTREEGLARMERIVSFLETADRFHGAYPHWWYGDTGRVKPFGQKDNGGDLVETAFIMQALLAVHQYYAGGNPQEKALAARIDKLWREVDWNFYRQGDQNVLYWHWSLNTAGRWTSPCTATTSASSCTSLPPPRLRMACPPPYTTKAGRRTAPSSARIR